MKFKGQNNSPSKLLFLNTYEVMKVPVSLRDVKCHHQFPPPQTRVPEHLNVRKGGGKLFPIVVETFQRLS
jgi:hypothetical protein